jgi:hypothetical protein
LDAKRDRLIFRLFSVVEGEARGSFAICAFAALLLAVLFFLWHLAFGALLGQKCPSSVALDHAEIMQTIDNSRNNMCDEYK